MKRLYEAYRDFGWRFFLPKSFKEMSLSAEEWQRILEEKQVVFIGGHHRSGTTLVWDRISKHPEIGAFGSQRVTGVDFSEGAFVQDVYPTFGVGQEFEKQLSEKEQVRRRRARQGEKEESVSWAEFGYLLKKNFYDIFEEITFAKPPLDLDSETDEEEWLDGMGRYALGPPEKVHWTESHKLVNADSQRRILNRFGFYWTRKNLDSPEIKVLIEKSPTNAVISRFLEAVVNIGRCDNVSGNCWTPSAPFPVRGAASFVFVQRHPIATSLAHLEWRECKDMQLNELVAHWVAVSVYMKLDAAKLERAVFVRLEDFAADPAVVLREVWSWLGLEADDDDAFFQGATSGVVEDPNAKYVPKYCEDGHFENHASLVEDWGRSVSNFGYDLDEWGTYCAELDTSDAEFSSDSYDL